MIYTYYHSHRVAGTEEEWSPQNPLTQVQVPLPSSKAIKLFLNELSLNEAVIFSILFYELNYKRIEQRKRREIVWLKTKEATHQLSLVR